MVIKKKKEKTIGGLAKTVDNLAVSMEKGFKATDKKIESLASTVGSLASTVDSLAIITKNGFEDVGGRISKVEDGLNNLVKSNTREHEEIKLRQDEVSYRFELAELQKRIEVLERRNGIKIA